MHNGLGKKRTETLGGGCSTGWVIVRLLWWWKEILRFPAESIFFLHLDSAVLWIPFLCCCSTSFLLVLIVNCSFYTRINIHVDSRTCIVYVVHTHIHIYIYTVYTIDVRIYISLSLLPPNSSAFLLLFCTEPCFWLIMRLSVHLSSYLGATRIPPSNITIGTHCGVLLLDWVVFRSRFLSGPFFSLYSSSLLGFYFLRKSFGKYKRLFLLFPPPLFLWQKKDILAS